MKTLLLSVLLLCGLCAHAQTPPKGATAVLVQTPDSAAAALRTLAGLFVAQGYTVDKLDKEFLTLTLAAKALPGSYNPVLRIRASATAGGSSLLRLGGDYQAGLGSVRVAHPATYEGSPTGTNKTTFAELQKAARAYPAGRVSYSQ